MSQYAFSASPESKNVLPQATSGRKRFALEWMLLLAFMLAMGVFLYLLQQSEYRDIIDNETQRLDTQSALFERNIMAQLGAATETLDYVMHNLPAWRLRKDNFAQANRELAIAARILPGVTAIMIADADGSSIAASLPKLIGQNYAYRDYFKRAQKRRFKGTYLTAPYRSVLGKMTISLVREITGADGEFNGFVILGLDDRYFSTLLSSLNYEADMSTFLGHGSGKLFLMSAGGPGAVQPDPETAQLWYDMHLKAATRRLSGEANESGIVHQERINLMRVIEPSTLNFDEQLVILVTRDKGAISGHWRRGIEGYVTMYLTLLAIAALGLIVIQRRQRMIEIARETRHHEREQLTRDIETTSKRLHEAQRIAQLGTWQIAIQSAQIYVSDEMYEIYEIDQKRSLNKTDSFLDAVHPDDNEFVRHTFHNAPSSIAPNQIIFRLQMIDGRIKWLEAKWSTEFDTSGQPEFIRGTVQDITVRMENEEQQRVAATLFNAQEEMLITDNQGAIVRVNQAFITATGHTQEEVVGQQLHHFTSARHDHEFHRAMKREIVRTGHWQGEIWECRKDGSEYPKWLAVSVVRNARGEVTHYVATLYDITERKAAEEKIKRLAFFDQITDLPNRTLLADRIKQTMAMNSVSGQHGGLLLIDLDDFKTINDTLGHEQGDALLREQAWRLVASVHEADTVARIGGDEFVVMLTSLSSNEAEAAASVEAICERIRHVIGQPCTFASSPQQITPSIGATVFQGHQTPIDEVLKQAELAMYKAKITGRNAVRFFDPAMEAAVIHRIRMEADLKAGLTHAQFALHYQLQVDERNRPIGAEALLRWHHPERGMVSPAEFIPLAEETDVILPLGRWVLDAACAQIAAWSSQPHLSALGLSVNVSARQFQQSDFVDQVLAAVDSQGINPQRLKLELTESLLVDNVQEVIEKMSALKARGISFSLDDFGTGYSSLAYLKRLPLAQLKIDQSFVRDLTFNQNDAVIARTVISLARSLDLHVIAEGVETAAQRDFLIRNNCHAYQGYLFARPLPCAAFESLVAEYVGKAKSG